MSCNYEQIKNIIKRQACRIPNGTLLILTRFSIVSIAVSTETSIENDLFLKLKNINVLTYVAAHLQCARLKV